jgi:hypothetical protein
VADEMANLNAEVSGSDPCVSPECIVAWRFKKGGSSQFYSGTTRVRADKLIPTVALGMDIQEIGRIQMGELSKRMDAARKGEPLEDDIGQSIQAELDKLKLKPKRRL